MTVSMTITCDHQFEKAACYSRRGKDPTVTMRNIAGLPWFLTSTAQKAGWTKAAGRGKKTSWCCPECWWFLKPKKIPKARPGYEREGFDRLALGGPKPNQAGIDFPCAHHSGPMGDCDESNCRCEG